MGSALLNPAFPDSTFSEAAHDSAVSTSASAAPESPEALRLQVTQRLAAHRSRRGQARTEPALENPREIVNQRAARIAATVAERYAHSQSYRAFLAAEAERAIQQARAAAEVAARNAQAVAAAQQKLLDDFDQAAAIEAGNSRQPERGKVESQLDGLKAHVESAAEVAEKAGTEFALWPELEADALAKSRPIVPNAAKPSAKGRSQGTNSANAHSSADRAGLTVRLYQDAPDAAPGNPATQFSSPFSAARVRSGPLEDPRNDAEARALDEEIAFRQAPVFEEPAGPPMPLPANLIEFPRQLVAPRKARPRYAEGPLREDSVAEPGTGQLRIFEVDFAQISTQPDPANLDLDAATPQWTSIWLDTPTAPGRAAQVATGAMATDPSAAHSLAPPAIETAPLADAAGIRRRIMASAINGLILSSALLAFGATFVFVAGRLIQGPFGAPVNAGLAGSFAALASHTAFPSDHLPGAIAVACALLYLIYQALFFWFSDATPGMRSMRIALCTFDDENPTRRAVRLRALAVLLSAIPLGLGLLWAALDEDHLTWHDRVSRTYQRKY